MDCIAKVVAFHCYMVPTIHMQGEHSLLYYHAEVSLQKDIGTTLLSYYSNTVNTTTLVPNKNRSLVQWDQLRITSLVLTSSLCFFFMSYFFCARLHL